MCDPHRKGLDCSEPFDYDGPGISCDCNIRCTVDCLNTCHGVVERFSVREGQDCFGKCTHVCLRGCAFLGKPSLEGFGDVWDLSLLKGPVELQQDIQLETSTLVQEPAVLDMPSILSPSLPTMD